MCGLLMGTIVLLPTCTRCKLQVRESTQHSAQLARSLFTFDIKGNNFTIHIIFLRICRIRRCFFCPIRRCFLCRIQCCIFRRIRRCFFCRIRRCFFAGYNVVLFCRIRRCFFQASKQTFYFEQHHTRTVHSPSLPTMFFKPETSLESKYFTKMVIFHLSREQNSKTERR